MHRVMVAGPYELTETLERIRYSAGMNSKPGRRTWLEVLELWDRNYAEIVQGRKNIPEGALVRLANHLKLNADDVYLGNVNYNAIVATRDTADAVFPEKYSIATFGRRRTTITSLDFVGKKSGWRVRADCLEHLGVAESLFTDPMASISMSFITDLCAYLKKKHGYGPADFCAMGAYSATGNRNTLLSEAFRRAGGPEYVYELLFGELLKYYEQNCTYALQSLSADSGIVHVTANPYIAEALGVRALGNPEICALKAGWISSAMDYLGLPFARVKETACVHRGDPTCRFEFDFSQAARDSRARAGKPLIQ